MTEMITKQPRGLDLEQTLVRLPRTDLDWLRRQARRRRVSLASLVADAVRAMRESQS